LPQARITIVSNSLLIIAGKSETNSRILAQDRIFPNSLSNNSIPFYKHIQYKGYIL
jgi:hypothetical protein